MSNALDGGMLVPEPAMAQMWPSGEYVDLLNPDPAKIHAPDIAHHLGMLCRYGGGVSRFYSVAEHSVLVADLLEWQGQPSEVVLAGLLHDAAEAYVGDMIAPLKFALRALEAVQQPGVHRELQTLDNGAWFIKPPREMRGIYAVLCEPVEAAVGEAFDLDPELFEDPRVKTADMWALKIEAAALTYHGGRHWRYPHDLPNDGLLPADIVWHGGLGPGSARNWFTIKLEELGG